jgi:DNA repair exonuclease SbcCD ATPase subunit
VFFSNKRFLLVFLVLILVLTPFWLMFDKVPLYAQDQQVQSEDVEKPFSEKLKDPAFVKKRLEEIQARLEQWNNLDREAVAKQYMVRETDVASRINTYNAIESFYRRLVTAMEKTLTFSQELKKMEAAKEQPADSLVEEKPPYNLSFYETYLDKIDTADQRAISLQNSIKQLKASAEATRSEIGKVESRVRVLKEQVDKVGLESVPDLTWEYQGAQSDPCLPDDQARQP